MEPTNQPQIITNHTHRAVTFLAISLVILAGVLFMAYKRGALSTKQQTASQSTAVQATDPNIWMKLESATGTSQFAQVDQVKLNAVASSSTKDVVGYDALIKYDPVYFDVVSVSSADPSFQAVSFQKSGMISVTGTRSPSVTTQTKLSSTPLLSIVLKPKKKGTTTVSIEPVVGAEKTKMMDAASTVLTPQLTPITLAIY